jgi:hypothetical protein
MRPEGSKKETKKLRRSEGRRAKKKKVRNSEDQKVGGSENPRERR